MCAMSKTYIAPTLSAIWRMRAKSHRRGYALAPPMISFGLLALGDGFHLVVVDGLGVSADVIEGGAIELAAEAEPVAVRQMAAVGEIEAKDGIARSENGGVGRGVGLRAGVRLHVDVLGAEDLLGAIAGEILNNVGVFASAIVAAAWVAFGVFVGEDGAGGLQHRFGDEVFAGNHLQPLVLAEGFMVDGGGDLGVGLGKRERHPVSHIEILRQGAFRGSRI